MSVHTIFVCTTCASKWENGKRVGESGGEKLLKRLQDDYPNWGLNTEFTIQPVECMSACNRSCVVSFASLGKTTYLFGDISPELTPEGIKSVFIYTKNATYIRMVPCLGLSVPNRLKKRF